MGPPGQETKFLPETPARQIFCANFGGLLVGRLSFAMLLLGGIQGSGQSSELGALPSDSTPNTHKLYSIYYM